MLDSVVVETCHSVSSMLTVPLSGHINVVVGGRVIAGTVRCLSSTHPFGDA
jgi:hypothetical protein